MLIASADFPMNPYGPAIDQLEPYKGTRSGAKEDHKPTYKSGPKGSDYPLLTLEDDIIREDGLGLRKGFYEVKLDDNFTYLLLVQSGKLKAKVPVVYIGRKDANSAEKLSEKEEEKRKWKYRKGEDPKEIVHSSVKMTFDMATNSYILDYTMGNILAKGILKL